MPDDIAGQAPNNDSGQGSPPPSNTPPPPGAPPTNDALLLDGEPFDPARAMALISKLRDGEKLSRAQTRELDTLKSKMKEIEDAKLSESERLTNENAELKRQMGELEKRFKTTTTRGALTSAAGKAGAVHSDAVAKLIELDSVEYDASGEPTNIDKLIADAKKAWPTFFRVAGGSADGGSGGNGTPPPGGMNALIRQAAGRT